MSAAVTPAPFAVRALVIAGAIGLAAVLVVRAQRRSAAVPAPTATPPPAEPAPTSDSSAVADVVVPIDSTGTPDGQDPNLAPSFLLSSKSGPPAPDPLLAEPAPVFFLPSSKSRGVDPSFLPTSKSLGPTTPLDSPELIELLTPKPAPIGP